MMIISNTSSMIIVSANHSHLNINAAIAMLNSAKVSDKVDANMRCWKYALAALRTLSCAHYCTSIYTPSASVHAH